MSRCHRLLPCTLLFALGLVGACACHAGPSGGRGSVVVDPGPSHGPPRTLRRVVYTCISAELVVFSDRPCGPLPQRVELRLLDPGAGLPGASASVRAPTPAASTRVAARGGPIDDDGPGRDEAAARAETCERLEAAVRTLDDRMRAGYSAREAARLWSRWREAKSRLREADC